MIDFLKIIDTCRAEQSSKVKWGDEELAWNIANSLITGFYSKASRFSVSAMSYIGSAYSYSDWQGDIRIPKYENESITDPEAVTLALKYVRMDFPLCDFEVQPDQWGIQSCVCFADYNTIKLLRSTKESDRWIRLMPVNGEMDARYVWPTFFSNPIVYIPSAEENGGVPVPRDQWPNQEPQN